MRSYQNPILSGPLVFQWNPWIPISFSDIHSRWYLGSLGQNTGYWYNHCSFSFCLFWICFFVFSFLTVFLVYFWFFFAVKCCLSSCWVTNLIDCYMLSFVIDLSICSLSEVFVADARLLKSDVIFSFAYEPSILTWNLVVPWNYRYIRFLHNLWGISNSWSGQNAILLSCRCQSIWKRHQHLTDICWLLLAKSVSWRPKLNFELSIFALGQPSICLSHSICSASRWWASAPGS